VSQLGGHDLPDIALLRALSIRQPYAELIMRGEKSIEYRTQLTHIRGRIYIYATARQPDVDACRDARVDPDALVTGHIIGTVVLTDCLAPRWPWQKEYRWTLTDPQRLPEPLKPTGHPQPVWFYPFGREP
jgi:hypothetical protein